VAQRRRQTNIGAGIALAQQVAAERGRHVTSVMVVETDGANNVDNALLDQRVAAAKNAGFLIFTVGVGAAIDADQLQNIASALAGVQTTYLLSDYTSLTATLNQITTSVSPAANNVSYEVAAAPGWEVSGATATNGTVGHSASSVTWTAPQLHT